MNLLSKSLKKTRLKKINPYIYGDVLDLGCGDGSVYKRYQHKIKTYYGIEVDKQKVKNLQKKYLQAKFYYRDLDTDLFNINQKFDTILLLAVIEHIFNQKHLFIQIKKYLKTSGQIIITTPTYFGNDIIHNYGSFLGLFDKKAHDDHIVIYNKNRFNTLCQEFNLRIKLYKKFQFHCNQLVVLKRK